MCLCLCAQRQISWALCCWRRASTALSVMMTRFTSSSLREARSRLPTRARPRCPGSPECARSERPVNPNTAIYNRINAFTGFETALQVPARSQKERVEQERVKVTNHSKWKMVGLLNGFCQLHRMNVNGFQRTFLFLNELPRSSRCNINAKSASSWSSLITVSSLTEVLSLCHCCQAKYKSTNLHLQWQTLPLTLLPYPHLQLRLLLLFFLYFPSHLISLAVSIPSLDSMPSNHS